jgi:4-nitrophenyl phosphatase
LRFLKKKIFFVTNNSTTSRKDYIKKFKKLKIDANLNEIISSSYLSAEYIKLNHKDKVKNVYIIGEKGI